MLTEKERDARELKRRKELDRKLAQSVALVASRSGALNCMEAKDPEMAGTILHMLAEGYSYKHIHKELGVSWDTVSRMRSRHCMVLEEGKAKMANDPLELAEGLRLLQKEKMRQLAENPEELSKTNMRDLALPYGIAVDKFLAVTGENRVVMEHRGGKPTLEEAMAAIEEARKKLRGISIEVVAEEVKP
jgi:hypothetical protein